MTDEEKKAIEDLKEVVELYNDKCLITTEDDFKSIEILLNLIDKQSKEIEHQKEKNKELEIEFEIKKYCKVNELASDLVYYKNLAREYQGNSVSKDKIKAKIEEIKKEMLNEENSLELFYRKKYCKEVLQSLLRKEFPVTITKEELEKRWKE